MRSYSQELITKIKKKKVNVSIFGVGYVGIKLVLALAKKNCNVSCFDKDDKKIKQISSGISPFSYISNREIREVKKNIIFQKNLREISNADVIIMCLPTPLYKGKPDLSHIKNCWDKIKNYIQKGQLIILESTTYPGCTEEIFIKYLRNKFFIDKEIFLSYSPERENPGDSQFNFKNTPKVVSGIGNNSLKICDNFYKLITKKTVRSPSIKIAEMSKLLENIYRSINIALINELKIATTKLDINIYDVIKIASTKPFGFQKFFPGPGTGGHCIPIDPIYFSWLSKKKGVNVKFIELSSKINQIRTKWIIKKLKTIAKKISNPKILLLGLSYKKNIEDTRESASVKILEDLLKQNYKIDYSDPFNKKITLNYRKKRKFLFSKKFDKKIIKKYNLIIIATDHDKFDYSMLKSSNKIIVDLRGKFKNIKSKYIYQL
tara:strand:+ start:824 stop:2122 length:1299 start_codon:yes stop_codon:yes gene_type:complete